MSVVQPPLAAHLRARLAVMHPAYFAMAMATGVVAIACHLFGLRELAVVLSGINLVVYPVLWILFIARVVMFPDRVAADLRDHARAPGYFTVVAATGVLGTQLVLLHG
jgi:tellurite resistance protein TehA-like permease